MRTPPCRFRLFPVVCLLIAWLTGLPAFARRSETGFLDRTVTVDGKTCRDPVFVPANFRKLQIRPVILALDGSGECGEDGLQQTDVGIGHAIGERALDFPFIVVMPQSHKSSASVELDMQAQALAALDAETKEFNGDRPRTTSTF